MRSLLRLLPFVQLINPNIWDWQEFSSFFFFRKICMFSSWHSNVHDPLVLQATFYVLFRGLFGWLSRVLWECLCQHQSWWFYLHGGLELTGSPTMDRLWLWRTQWVFMGEEIPEGQYWLSISHLKYLPCNLGLRQILMTKVTSHTI